MADTQSSPTQETTQKKSHALAATLVCVVAAVALIALIGFTFIKPAPPIVEGMADATSVRISGKLPGRVAEIFVEEGQDVKAGDTLIHIHSSLAEARLFQAEAIESATAAQNRKIDAGTRRQIVQAARDLMDQAAAARSITEKTYNRMEALYKEKVVSEQKRDEAKAAYDAALASENAARSQYEMAREGAQREDKESAAAMVSAAKGSVMEVEALLQDQYLTAPCDGQIDVIYPHEGELVSLGAPVMNLVRLDRKYVTFNVREELLDHLKMGQEIDVMIPALDRKEIKAKIYYIRDMGSYAVWRATKATGQWDSRTFQVKARPLDSIPDLRPGMSVILRHSHD